ncbi:Ku protein [Cupriavidus neocaledonicus]|uniref:Non-homologous end joining protein Ku n=1 Tax=Cupriavidus neocaledonicus TaxID=1040979 RepID=A0A375HTZ1_9BURK|nr:Ku protein [Cupriavidus neocaledonicus]SOZ39724.1 Putative Ku domain containing protein [Cupriavidus neocaledonicus]SPD60945.1 Non-homologous end joining protein Ku [Cupriavidus neocaledonicus]
MAARSLASLSLSFGLVSIPVKLYTATESSSAVRFNLLSKDGSRVRQQYISEQTQKVVERADMIKGYEFEKGRFVTFAPDELKALEESASHMVDIVAFIPEQSVDPLYYDKAYFIAPDKRGGKPYSLLREAMSRTGRCAIAKWASKGKSHVVQIRPVEGGLVFQQLLFADEVRNIAELNIEEVAVSDAELKLAIQLIEQASEEEYDPTQYKDEEKARILAAIDAKIAGKHIVAPEPVEAGAGGQVIDLMDALRASLSKKGTAAAKGKAAAAAPPARKAARRGAAAEPTPIRRTTKKSA